LTYIVEILNIISMGPFSKGTALFCSLAVLGGGHMIDNRFNIIGIINPILSPAHQIVDGDGGGDFMTENPVQV
jgi:hypothetical protein